MLLYTSFPQDVFEILVAFIKRVEPLNYYQGWPVKRFCTEDELLMTLMKLKLNLRDLDLADRFDCSKTTVANICHTYIFALHEIFFEGIMKARVPSQLKCKGSMPKSFDDFASARMAIDATEVSQDIPSDLNKQSAAFSNYKSKHTMNLYLRQVNF